MSKEKFSKGPWQAFDIHPENACFNIATDQVPTVGTGIKYVMNEVCTVYASSNASRANAHLIASAPDMYAMLEGIMTDEIDGGSLHRANLIKKLLSKARGEK